MSSALRPVLRPTSISSISRGSSATPTYICQACRHARLLKRPKRPYTFTQLVTLSDGSAFTMRTTSPVPVYRSTRDTRNAALWNPTSKELLSVEDDEAGRLAGFRARFGTGFDSSKEAKRSLDGAQESVASSTKTSGTRDATVEDEKNDFVEDDMNLLDMISSFGREKASPDSQATDSQKKGKK